MVLAKIIKFVVWEIMYSGHLQSLGAVSIAFVAAVVLGVPQPVISFLIVYALFQGIYFYDRYHDLHKDAATNKERAMHMKTYYGMIPIIIALLFLFVFLAALYAANTLSLVFLFLVAFFGVLYPAHIKPATKKVLFLKNIYVSLVFTTVVFYPAIFSNSTYEVLPVAVSLALFVFLESIITQIILDIKDTSVDSEHKLKTLPALVGDARTISLLKFVSIIVPIVMLVLGFAVRETYIFTIMAVAAYLFNQITLHMISRKVPGSHVIASLKYLLWPLVLLIA